MLSPDRLDLGARERNTVLLEVRVDMLGRPRHAVVHAAIVHYRPTVRSAGNDVEILRKDVDLDQLQFNWGACKSGKVQC